MVAAFISLTQCRRIIIRVGGDYYILFAWSPLLAGFTQMIEFDYLDFLLLAELIAVVGYCCHWFPPRRWPWFPPPVSTRNPHWVSVDPVEKETRYLYWFGIILHHWCRIVPVNQWHHQCRRVRQVLAQVRAQVQVLARVRVEVVVPDRRVELLVSPFHLKEWR